MNELSKKTISQIVTENHLTARIFEKYGLDFCCKGKRSLESACIENNISKEMIMEELNDVIADKHEPNEFDSMTLTALSEHIVRVHHDYCKEEMPRISEYLLKVATKHGDRFPYMKEVYNLFSELKGEMTQHMEKEERILFPAICKLETQEYLSEMDISAPLAVMIDEHDRAGSILLKIRKLTSDYIAHEEACTTHRLVIDALSQFEKDLHWHVHLENNILFPKTMVLFNKIRKVQLN